MVDREGHGIKMKSQRFISIAMLLFLAMPFVLGYEVRTGLGSLNLWDVLIDYTFGNFWVAVFAIAVLYFIILLFGGISSVTSIMFLAIFIGAMSMGYAPLYAVIVFAASVIFFLWQLVKIISDMS